MLQLSGKVIKPKWKLSADQKESLPVVLVGRVRCRALLCGWLAGLLHIAEYGAGPLLLSEPTMQNALALARVLGDHALAAFGLMGTDSANEDAQFIFRWITALAKAIFTQSELTIACRHKNWTSARVDESLQILQMRHLISTPVRQPGRFKPTTVYAITNPSASAKKPRPKARADPAGRGFKAGDAPVTAPH